MFLLLLVAQTVFQTFKWKPIKKTLRLWELKGQKMLTDVRLRSDLHLLKFASYPGYPVYNTTLYLKTLRLLAPFSIHKKVFMPLLSNSLSCPWSLSPGQSRCKSPPYFPLIILPSVSGVQSQSGVWADSSQLMELLISTDNSWMHWGKSGYSGRAPVILWKLLSDAWNQKSLCTCNAAALLSKCWNIESLKFCSSEQFCCPL